MPGSKLAVVTGAFSYTGRSITRLLLARGQDVRSLTNHPDRPNPFGQQVKAFPYGFDRPDALTRTLEDTATLYNTYWIRFPHGGLTFDQAVANSRTLFRAAKAAGVGKIIHISVTNASSRSPLPYFRGKGQVEEALAKSGVPYAILRPTLIFGPGDILINNIAWLLRRFPVFALPGSGDYRPGDLHLCRIGSDDCRRPRQKSPNHLRPASAGAPLCPRVELLGKRCPLDSRRDGRSDGRLAGI
jgi:NADH dehydrogenase